MASRLQLPFNLPCHLKVSSYRRATGSHAGGNTIDLTIFPEGGTYPKHVAEYIRTYTELFGHLKYGVLRINAEKTNWHYHLQADREKYESGEEHFVYKVGALAALNDQPGQYIAVAPIKKINHKNYGALAKFSTMIDSVTARLFGYNSLTSIFSLDYWREFVAYLGLGNKSKTYIYFEPDANNDSKITENELKDILQCLSAEYEQTALASMLPGSPLDQSQFKNILIVGGIVAAFLYFTRKD